MKWLVIVLLAVAGLAGLVYLAGSLLPRTHRATSEALIRRPPDAVWAVVRDFGALSTWWPEMKSVERRPDREGREAWAQTMRNGSDLPIEVAESIAPSRLVTDIAFPPGAPFGGRWIYRLEPVPEGTRIVVTEDGWIDNKLFRVVSRLMGYHGTLDGYLRALGARLGQTVTPAHVSDDGAG
jgi:uncharacterized protein YndB with AHSA1/START domain